MALRLAVGEMLELPREVFVFVHPAVAAILFSFVFWCYFRGHRAQQPFTVMCLAFLWILLLEVTVRPSWFSLQDHLFTYVDWFVPGFVIVSMVYAVGRLMRSS